MSHKNRNIVVVGLQSDEELFTLLMISVWLDAHRPGYSELAQRLRSGGADFDVYDMATLPEKGDGLDAIGDDTALVVALHLFGIDKLPGGNTAAVTEMDPRNCYNRNNLELLGICMERSIPLIAVGDQPWLGLQKRTLMYGKPGPQAFAKGSEPLIYLYETKGQ